MVSVGMLCIMLALGLDSDVDIACGCTLLMSWTHFDFGVLVWAFPV